MLLSQLARALICKDPVYYLTDIYTDVFWEIYLTYLLEETIENDNYKEPKKKFFVTKEEGEPKTLTLEETKELKQEENYSKEFKEEYIDNKKRNFGNKG